MQSWGQEMGQQYRSYDDHVQANYYGLQVPQDILVVNGQPSLIKRPSRWSGQKMVRDKPIFRLWQPIRHRPCYTSWRASLFLWLPAKAAKSSNHTTKSRKSKQLSVF